jgi:hypothetical protein
MCKKVRMTRSAGWIALAFGVAYAPWAVGNGGPFVIKYPGGDPAAKGVLARIDPDLKPGREERLRVVKEDLKVLFMQDPGPHFRPVAAASRESPAPKPSLLEQQPPLALVSAIYTIENPTEEAIEVEFGFPILRGIYVQPWSMMPTADAQVKLDSEQIRPDLISNSMLYGLIRQRSQAVIDKALAADPELARLVAAARTTSYVRQRAREAIQRVTSGQDHLLKAVQADANLAKVIAAKSDSADPDRAAARQALMDYLTGSMKWEKGPATLMVEYASMELGQVAGGVPDASFHSYWGNIGELSQLAYANLGRLAAIGEQKTTQLFAELASRFDPSVKPAYEAIFAAWGGDVRERSVDLRTGQVRPRELSLDPKLSSEALAGAAAADPTIYARMEYINPNAGLTEGEKASCEAVIENLPVTFTFAPMNLLHYTAKFPASSTRTLTVSYKQYAYADTREPGSFQLAYVVHPASLWKEFGPIELEVAVPEGLGVRSSVACREAGVEEREVPKNLPGINPDKTKVKVALHRATVTEKTGELFLAVDADGWKRLGEPKPNVTAETGPAPNKGKGAL